MSSEPQSSLPPLPRHPLIYGSVLDTAIEDTVDVWESSLFDWLAKLWDVTVDFEGGAPGDA